MDDHAFMTPSSAERDFACAAAPLRVFQVEQRAELFRQVGAEFYGLKDSSTLDLLLDDDNPMADRGTRLHSVLERCVRERNIDDIRQFMIDEGLEKDDYNNQYIIEKLTLHTNLIIAGIDKSKEVFIEERLHYKGLPSKGACDYAYLRGTRLHVDDFKSGRSEVVAKNNKQLMSYGVIILDNLGWPITIKDVEFRILGLHFDDSSFRMTVKELRKWKDEIALPAFMAAYNINPKATPGDHCFYCPAKIHCQEWQAMMKNELSNEVFENTDFVEAETEELERLYILAKQAERFVNEAKTELLVRFEGFDEPTHVKRVNGKKYVAWVDDEKTVVSKLSKKVTDSNNLYNQTLKTPKEVEALVGDPKAVEGMFKTTVGRPYIKL